MLILSSALFLCCLWSSAWSFQPTTGGRPLPRSRTASRATSLKIVPKEQQAAFERIKLVIESEEYPKFDAGFDKTLKGRFPGAITNVDLETAVVDILSQKGFTGGNTLLATSLCCDELARQLEDDFVRVYGNNFNLGGLAGFPFAGNTGFGAMSAHIPDDGFCLIVYGPHVGITKDGLVGKVERAGIELVDNCCGSAIAASNYLKGITDGGAVLTTDIRSFTDFQQGAVQQLILPHGQRLTEARDDRMLELPYALYESQDLLLREIVVAGAGGLKKGTALLGGIQINTSPDTQDYFHPLRFDYLSEQGKEIEDLLPMLFSGGRPAMTPPPEEKGPASASLDALEEKHQEEDEEEEEAEGGGEEQEQELIDDELPFYVRETEWSVDASPSS